MKYLIGLMSLVFLFSMLAYAQNTSTDEATIGLPGKGMPERSITSPNAWVPNKMSYQGLLTTTGGAPAADGSYELKFELFNVASSGTALWSETQAGVNVYKGTFSVLLGSVTPLAGIFYQPLWVEVTANSGPGIAAPILFTPRTELASAAYSLGPWFSDSGKIWVTDNKHVGINTTDPEFPIDVETFTTPTVAKFGHFDPLYLIRWNPIIGFNIYYRGGFRYGSTNEGGATLSYDQEVGNGFSFNTAPNGTADEVAALTPRMVIRDTGRVGIGTIYPDKLLHVAGPVHVQDTLFIGASTQNGVLNLYQNGSTDPTLFIGTHSGYGGQLKLMEEDGTDYAAIQPDANGTGGFFRVDRGSNSTGFTIDGNYSGTQQPYVSVNGSSRSAVFNMSQTANNSVVLPDSSISAAEMFDEPGIVQSNTNSIINLPGTIMIDIDTISITIPASGYVMLEASGFAYLHSTTGQNQLYAQIDETAGGGLVSSHWTKIGLGSYSTTAANFFQIFCTRTYYKTAGTYTFRFEAAQVSSNGTGASTNIYETQLRAVYYPTSYGDVVTVLSQAEAAQYESAVLETGLSDQSDENSGEIGTFYKVNLRDLEIKALRARAEAERAERELLEAQIKQQANDNEPR